jgi:hypothetical protein
MLSALRKQQLTDAISMLQTGWELSRPPFSLRFVPPSNSSPVRNARHSLGSLSPVSGEKGSAPWSGRNRKSSTRARSYSKLEDAPKAMRNQPCAGEYEGESYYGPWNYRSNNSFPLPKVFAVGGIVFLTLIGVPHKNLLN